MARKPTAPPSHTLVLMVRHGQTPTTGAVLPGRARGLHLADAGREQAEAVAERIAPFADRVAAVYASPLERTRETAEPIAHAHGIEVRTDDRVIESTNKLEGHAFGPDRHALKDVRNWRHFWNPFRPSWGEPYAEVAARMLAACAAARDAAAGHEAVMVSHQLPIWIARRAVEGRRLWHRPDRRECALASITSFVYDGDGIVRVDYSEPAGALGRSQVGGA